MKKLPKKIRAAVIGGSESGKTYRVIGYSRGLWKRYGLRSIVFDPWIGENDWGPQAWVTPDFEKWKRAVTNTEGCVVIWDEATANGGRDRDNVPLYTEIRHRHPALFAIGHAYSVMLPIMRGSLTDLHIALADDDDAREWAKIMKDRTLLGAAVEWSPATPNGMKQYEFMHKRSFRPIVRRRETAEQIQAGILP